MKRDVVVAVVAAAIFIGFGCFYFFPAVVFAVAVLVNVATFLT